MRIITFLLSLYFLNGPGFGQSVQQHLKNADGRIAVFDYEAALDECEKALKIDPNSYEAITTLAIIKHHQHKYAEAIEQCNKAISINMKLPGAYWWRGNNKVAIKDYGGAIEDYNKAEQYIENKKMSPLLYLFRGNAKAMKGDLAGAIKDYDTELKIDHQYANMIYYNRGILKFLSKDYKGALDDLSLISSQRPDFKQAIHAKGTVHLAMKNYKDASACFNKVILMDSTYTEAYYHRGLLKAEQGNHAAAIRDFDMALRNIGAMGEPNPERFWYKMHCEKLLLLQPEEKEIYYQRMLAKIKTGDNKGVCADAAKAKKLGYVVEDAQLPQECK